MSWFLGWGRWGLGLVWGQDVGVCVIWYCSTETPSQTTKTHLVAARELVGVDHVHELGVAVLLHGVVLAALAQVPVQVLHVEVAHLMRLRRDLHDARGRRGLQPRHEQLGQEEVPEVVRLCVGCVWKG